MSLWTFVFCIVTVSIVGGLIATWIKAKHGYPLTDDNDQRIYRSSADSAKFDEICAENSALKTQLGEVTERLKVLERIATDPATRVSREIESLRERSDTAADTTRV